MLLAAVATPLVTGCASEQFQGRTRIAARYDGVQTLKARLPDDITPQAALAAARTTLERRGYVIETDDGSGSAGEICGVEFQEGALDQFFARKVIVRAREARPGAWVEVKTKPGGREAEARAVLDEILALLRL